MRAAVLLVLVLLVPGCIFTPGQDDLSGVCEVRSTSPAPPYTTDGIVLFTQVADTNLSAEKARAILAAVQPDVITERAARHANFSARLDATATGWRFEGVGRAANGTVVDTYTFDISEDAGRFTVQPLSPTVDDVLPPESMVADAQTMVNRTPELASALTKTPTLVASGWNPRTPACVTLLYQDGPSDAILPASAEHPHTRVVVSFSSSSVVLIKREGWSP